MKGDATTHTTNERYREGYDRIDWSVTGDPDHDGYQRMERKLFGDGREDLRVALGGVVRRSS